MDYMISYVLLFLYIVFIGTYWIVNRYKKLDHVDILARELFKNDLMQN